VTPSARPAAQTIPVVCGIIEQGHVFLAALRGPGQSNANLWEFPGGKVRNDEPAEAALVRELREELDIEVMVKRPLTPNRHDYPERAIELIPFICTITGGILHPREHAEIRWIDAASARSLVWAPADLPVLGEYLSFIKPKYSAPH
jgi:8-oxo-dGTP diphosphatase